jgi:multidrug resistance efflux pump
MKTYSPISTIFLLTILTIVTSGCGILLAEGGTTTAGFQASGVVEAIEIVLAPEVGGKISDVFVSEGDKIAAGDPLFEIDGKLVRAQLEQAKAAYNIALANYELIAAGQTNEQRQASITAAELELASAKYDLDNLFEDTDLLAAQSLQTAESLERALENLLDPSLQQALALKAIADAKKSIENAERRYLSVSSSADESDIAAAEAQVVLAKDALDQAVEDFEPYENKPEDNLTRANYQSKLAAAQQAYDAAVRKLNSLRGTGSEADKAVAEADLAAAKAQLSEAERKWGQVKDGPRESEVELIKANIAKAYKDYEIYKNGPDPDDLTIAEARFTNAEALLALAQAKFPTKEELDVAQAQVDSAKSNLDALQIQIELLVVKSPIDGVVMTRNIELGEVIQPGSTALTISQLENLSITVYIPENRYGQVSIGDNAILEVDSFPDLTFNASVIRIADQAEFTPRNVQTKEDRQTTVYAIKLKVNDPQGKLKPGMPVDVIFVDVKD